MNIDIADRLKPFSHTPGHEAIIPGTTWKAKVFPTALLLEDVQSNQKKELFWDLKGPMKDFTVEEDLEGKSLRIHGQSLFGYFRLVLRKEGTSLVLNFEKTPAQGIAASGLVETVFQRGDVLSLEKDLEICKPLSKERLFLGVSKQKEWGSIRKRRDLKEILPLWHRSGLIAPCKEIKNKWACLLKQAITKKQSEEASDLLLQTYLAHFSEGLVPRKRDEEFQGIGFLEEQISSAYHLLAEGSFLIRSLFFQETEESISILPCLPREFVSGKMIHIQAKNGSTFHLEWTKHKLRRMCIKSMDSSSLKLCFPKEIQSYRKKTSLKDPGKILGRDDLIEVSKGETVWLDLFQK
jgi:hypothetical protein